MATGELFETKFRTLSTVNGDSFGDIPELRDLWLKAKSAMQIYNMIIRRPLSQQNDFFEMAKEGIKKLIEYEGTDLTLDTLMKYIESLNVYLGMFIYDKKKVYLGPNVGSKEAKGFLHVDISKRILTPGSKTQATISGYTIINPFYIGNERVEGIFFADKDIANSGILTIDEPDLASHPLSLLQNIDEEGNVRYLLYASSENEPLKFKKPISK